MNRFIDFAAIAFKSMSPYNVLKLHKWNNEGCYISPKTFLNMVNRQLHELTNDEAYNLYDAMQNIIELEKELLNTSRIKNDEIQVFDILLVVANHLLEERGIFPVCKYEHILGWRKASLEVDPDVYITAFLAFKDLQRGIYSRDFNWKPIIANNNTVLKTVLDRGISENHFHLNGSAQYFQLSWIHLMNCIEHTRIRDVLADIDKDRLNHEYVMSGYANDSLYLRSLKAAVIRLFLFCKLNGFYNNEEIRRRNTENCINNDGVGKETAPIEVYLDDEKIYSLMKCNEDMMTVFCSGIETYITSISGLASNESFDYACLPIKNLDAKKEYFSGERWLMYTMFQKIYSTDAEMSRWFDLFYIYILLKESIRAELIQVNAVKGFDNFSLYEKRKSDLVDELPLEEIYARTAVRDTLENQPMIISLEARIAPRDTAEEMYKYIQRLDRRICADIVGTGSGVCAQQDSFLDKYFYVIHFIKSRDDKETLSAYDLCRQQKMRKKVKRQAMEFVKFREYYPQAAMRVRGIDAANTEIGCRPEVFAHAFRTLREHEIPGYSKPSRLGITYHVGEDFIDITDGLRAIEEAVLFFNMQYGDRMGHAMALGIDVEEWYQLKNSMVLIARQDYLDNIVWLYHKIIQYNISVQGAVMSYLEGEFYKYFRIIYQDNISADYADRISEGSKNRDIISGVEFNIRTYYNAWKLRGDDPENYINGFYENFNYTDLWDWNCVNRQYPEDKEIRKSFGVAFLYHTYHYNAKVKLAGDVKINISIPRNVQQVIKIVQERMQKDISDRGICIEANPSSNCLIGNFGKYAYEKHPMLKFYNCGLGPNVDIEHCHQISVCINTDDQTVFGTSLENEYALMARALENIMDENGNSQYDRNYIYKWLDEIRKIGNDFAFKEENKF